MPRQLFLYRSALFRRGGDLPGLLAQGIQAPVYAFEKIGIRPLKQAYDHLIEILSIDTVVLVDGGTDSLMLGDEEELGTPREDMKTKRGRLALPVQ